MTQGTLNAKQSNAVLMMTAIGGDRHRIDLLIGAGRGLDTGQLFVIKTDAIGNGLTTSPSTSASQHGLAFPHFTIRDMVQSDPVQEGIEAAGAIPQRQHVTIPSVQGHVAASPGFRAADLAFINDAVRRFMAGVTDNGRKL